MKRLSKAMRTFLRDQRGWQQAQYAVVAQMMAAAVLASLWASIVAVGNLLRGNF